MKKELKLTKVAIAVLVLLGVFIIVFGDWKTLLNNFMPDSVSFIIKIIISLLCFMAAKYFSKKERKDKNEK